MLLKNILLAGVGGFLGTVFRYVLALLIKTNIFPLATLLINISGSFLLGLILGYAAKSGQMESGFRIFMAIGFCGGYTTFSSFSYENVQLLKAGEYGYFFLYVGGSLVIGIFATYLGLLLMK